MLIIRLLINFRRLLSELIEYVHHAGAYLRVDNQLDIVSHRIFSAFARIHRSILHGKQSEQVEQVSISFGLLLLASNCQTADRLFQPRVVSIFVVEACWQYAMLSFRFISIADVAFSGFAVDESVDFGGAELISH